MEKNIICANTLDSIVNNTVETPVVISLKDTNKVFYASKEKYGDSIIILKDLINNSIQKGNVVTATYNISTVGTYNILGNVSTDISNDDDCGNGNGLFQIENVITMIVDGTEVTPALTYSFDKVGTHVIKFILFPDATDLSFMFCGGDSNVIPVTNIDFSTFSTSKILNMERMFYGCNNLVSLDVSNFDTRKVTNMNNMFRKCTLSKLDLSNFDLTSISDVRGDKAMFMQSTFTSAGPDSSYDLVFPKNLKHIGKNWFEKCPNLITLNIPDTVLEIRSNAAIWAEELVNLTIPESVIYFNGHHLFAYTSIEELTVPGSVIDYLPAAYNKDVLKRLYFPNAETVNCYTGWLNNFELIEFGPNLKYMNHEYLKYYGTVGVLKFNSIVPPKITNNLRIDHGGATSKILVPQGSLQAYIDEFNSHSNLKKFVNIIEEF